jgi:hypothetical protein
MGPACGRGNRDVSGDCGGARSGRCSRNLGKSKALEAEVAGLLARVLNRCRRNDRVRVLPRRRQVRNGVRERCLLPAKQAQNQQQVQ